MYTINIAAFKRIKISNVEILDYMLFDLNKYKLLEMFSYGRFFK